MNSGEGGTIYLNYVPFKIYKLMKTPELYILNVIVPSPQVYVKLG